MYHNSEWHIEALLAYSMASANAPQTVSSYKKDTLFYDVYMLAPSRKSSYQSFIQIDNLKQYSSLINLQSINDLLYKQFSMQSVPTINKIHLV